MCVILQLHNHLNFFIPSYYIIFNLHLHGLLGNIYFLHYAELKFTHFSCECFIQHQPFFTWLAMQQNHLLDPDQLEKCLALFHISIPLQMKWNVSCDGYNFVADKSKWLLHLKILHHSLVNESVYMNEEKINRNVSICQVPTRNNQ